MPSLLAIMALTATIHDIVLASIIPTWHAHGHLNTSLSGLSDPRDTGSKTFHTWDEVFRSVLGPTTNPDLTYVLMLSGMQYGRQSIVWGWSGGSDEGVDAPSSVPSCAYDPLSIASRPSPTIFGDTFSSRAVQSSSSSQKNLRNSGNDSTDNDTSHVSRGASRHKARRGRRTIESRPFGPPKLASKGMAFESGCNEPDANLDQTSNARPAYMTSSSTAATTLLKHSGMIVRGTSPMTGSINNLTNNVIAEYTQANPQISLLFVGTLESNFEYYDNLIQSAQEEVFRVYGDIEQAFRVVAQIQQVLALELAKKWLAATDT